MSCTLDLDEGHTLDELLRGCIAAFGAGGPMGHLGVRGADTALPPQTRRGRCRTPTSSGSSS
uniref:Uncharacterized protein n=1 Tax=Accipiter nisus TaxID=211598 RepID=A0A8B9RT74_9AVES